MGLLRRPGTSFCCGKIILWCSIFYFRSRITCLFLLNIMHIVVEKALWQGSFRRRKLGTTTATARCRARRGGTGRDHPVLSGHRREPHCRRDRSGSCGGEEHQAQCVLVQSDGRPSTDSNPCFCICSCIYVWVSTFLGGNTYFTNQSGATNIDSAHRLFHSPSPSYSGVK